MDGAPHHPAPGTLPRSSEGYVSVARAARRGMVSLRADLGAPWLKAALEAEGFALPGQRLIVPGDGDGDGDGGEAAWMSPDELLLFCAAGEGPALAARLEAALAGHHHLALDVSDLRCHFALEGDLVREVLAKLTPADTDALAVGEMRRSRLGQVAAAFWLPAEGRAEVIAFRSVAEYVFRLLGNAARPGSEVG